MNFSQGEKRYSHAGIIQKTNNGVFIIHSEEDKNNNRNGVYRESIQDFLEGIHIWGVYRLEKIKEQEIIDYALKLEKQNVLFDMDFNLDEDKKMYCSEFIYKVINRTTKDQIINPGKQFMGRTFVTISDLYQHDHAKLVDISHKIIKD